MKKLSYLLLGLVSVNSFAGAYVDLSLGAMHRQLDGDKLSYQDSQAITSEISVGYAGKKWDLGIDTLYSISRAQNLKLNYGETEIRDDFNWHSINIGPTLKYHVISKSGKWDLVPFVGAFYNHTVFENSAKLKGSNESEDKSHETWGYGGKLGMEFKKLTPSSSWAESVNYKVYGTYTKYRDVEGDYIVGNNVEEYKGDTPDNLHDYAVGFSVGFSIGDKLWKKTKSAAKTLATKI